MREDDFFTIQICASASGDVTSLDTLPAYDPIVLACSYHFSYRLIYEANIFCPVRKRGKSVEQK